MNHYTQKAQISADYRTVGSKQPPAQKTKEQQDEEDRITKSKVLERLENARKARRKRDMKLTRPSRQGTSTNPKVRPDGAYKSRMTTRRTQGYE
jgi:hypothetical protein